jgi:glyoxylase-like metal-dependent hydrolase (beta-lactamase superfamily II)
MRFIVAAVLLAGFLVPAGAQDKAAEVVQVAPAAASSRVPNVLRQGTFLSPQAVSSVDVTDDGSVAVCTMAFRHDKNFWLLSSKGEPLWGRQVAPWAPFQSAAAAGGGAFAVGMAHSRVTSPHPTISVFAGEKTAETEVVDSLGALGWLRYGSGDWRTGWIPSLIGDLVVRAGESIITVRGPNGGVRVGREGHVEKYPFPYLRPYRLASSGDGSSLVYGFIVPQPPNAAPGKSSVPWPKQLLSVADSANAKDRWSFGPSAEASPPPALPDPQRDFPEFAAEFGLKAEPPLPCRVAAAVSANADASLVAAADYGAWVSIRPGPVTGKWDPPYHEIPFVPRQRAILRIVAAPGRETASAPFPQEGLFDVRLDPAGRVVWAFPASWFARGMAGAPWLPADPDARSIHLFDVAAGKWGKTWTFPDAVSDVALHPSGDRAWVSCWDGNLYQIRRDGGAATRVDVGAPARLRWSPDGKFLVAGTESGDVIRLDDAGSVEWRTKLPVAEPRSFEGSMKPVIEGVPIYAVGRVGMEHAYVGDTWLVKTDTAAFLVDAGGTSAIPFTLQKIRAAGVDPATLRFLLHSHSHGDHSGGAYLWRTRGLKIVAPETAALGLTWLMPTVTDYGVWVPRPVDVPLPLKRVGDETEVTIEGVKIRAVFVPGHSYDLVVYLFELGGKRIAFTGDLGFKNADIVHRCWGDVDKGAAVTEAIRTKVLEFHPDVVFTGHDAHAQGFAFLEDLVKRSQETIRAARSK